MALLDRFSPSLRLVGFSAGILFALSACKGFEGATATVKPDPLEVHADSIKYTAKASVPPKSGLKRDGVYNGKLVIRSGDNAYVTGQIAIPKGTISKEEYKQIIKNGATVTQSVQAAYDEGMNGGTLKAIGAYERKGKKVDVPAIDLAKCCITTSRLVCAEYQLLEASHEYEKQVPITLEAKFQFPQNVADIQPTEYEKASIKAIGEFLKKQYKATKIDIAGFASPEGAFKRNQFLSVERSRQVQQWLVQQLRDNGYKEYLDSSFFSISTTTEDWEGFKANLDRTNYPEDVKRQIIEIISAGNDEDVKERKVMALVGGAAEVEFILSPLRRATIRLEGFSASHSDEQIVAFVNEFAKGRKTGKDVEGFFKQEELLYATTLTNDVDSRKKLLQEFARIYPNDWRGYNNLGVQAVRDGLADEALDYLTQADKKAASNSMILNNLGVVYLQKGNLREGSTRLNDAYTAKATAQTAFNLGVLREKRANYEEASKLFSTASDLPCGSYNAGLCKLLQNDLAGSKADLENAIRKDKERALNYYVLAIVGARSADLNLLTNNLKRAVQIDKMLAEKASNDLEFRQYWAKPEFKSAVTGN